MFRLDMKSRKSIYEQIVDHLKELILMGILKPEEKLPSVRDFSKTLTVNPNTIQKAYKELERQGYVYSTSGLGTFVAFKEPKTPDPERLCELNIKLRACLLEYYFLGVSKTELNDILKELLNERSDWK